MLSSSQIVKMVCYTIQVRFVTAAWFSLSVFFSLLPRLVALSQECVLEDPNVVDEVDSMMSTMGMGQVSAKATSALSSAKAWFTGKKRTDLFI